MRQKMQSVLFVIGLFLTIAVVAVGIYTYNANLNNRLAESTKETLSAVAAQQQDGFDNAMDTQITQLRNIAATLVIFGANESLILEYIQNLEQHYLFDNMMVVDLSGNGLMSAGNYISITDTDFFKEVIDTKTVVITDPMMSHFSDNVAIVMAIPILEHGEVVGVLAAEYGTSYLSGLLLNSFDGDGYTFVVGHDGDIVASNQNNYTIANGSKLFESLEEVYFYEGMTVELLREKMQSGQSGHLEYSLNGAYRLAEYRPLAVAGWSIMTVVPEDVISASAALITQEVSILNITILVACLLLVGSILLMMYNANKRIEQAAYYDELTGIPNLLKFKMEVGKMLRRYPNRRFYMVKFDVTNFKAINQMFDFETGNKVIKALADVGKTVQEKTFLQARVGTDEFLLFGCYEFFRDLDQSRIHYEGLFRERIPFLADHHVGLRYGRYCTEPGERDVNGIVDKTLLAHSMAKTNKEQSVYDYDDALKQHLLQMTDISNRMEQALKDKEFKVFLQPKYDLSNNRLAGAEALVRWVDGNGRLIFPNDFIPLFESNGFIVHLDRYMLEGVCRLLRRWLDEGLPCVPVSVNFSRLHLDNEDFAKEVMQIAKTYQIPSGLLEIELTESSTAESDLFLERLIDELHQYGFKVSMDDFGSGYSSLGLLKNYDIDVVKLDRSFFINARDAHRGELVVESVIQMAHKLDICTVAEGVETEEQVELLRKMDCEIAQGYFYAKPMPNNQFYDLLKES